MQTTKRPGKFNKLFLPTCMFLCTVCNNFDYFATGDSKYDCQLINLMRNTLPGWL